MVGGWWVVGGGWVVGAGFCKIKANSAQQALALAGAGAELGNRKNK